MLPDYILEKIFSNPEMRKIPVGCQSTAVTAFSDVLIGVMEENPDATIRELLSTEHAGIE